jgi:signal transduction histidine kinase
LQNEKLSTVGLLAGSIAHEVKNPLSAIKTLTAVLAEELGPASPHAEDLRMIRSEVDRLSATISQLLGFIRPARASREGCALEPLLQSTLGIMRHWAHERGVSIAPSCEAAAACVAADEATVREILFNLLKNAVEAVDRGGTVSVRTRVVDAADEASHVVVEIQDNGRGLTPEVQDRLFEPFVTTKAAGTGLGLYLVGREVRAAGGRIDCRSSPQDGTLFTFTLPLATTTTAH